MMFRTQLLTKTQLNFSFSPSFSLGLASPSEEISLKVVYGQKEVAYS